ncbi:unnamed protein product [marine sediment metagenome]|uniref:Uncharacterized protein n=1 Tax=marine sediment metagenome TaxID=412755 RepID=X1IKV4_9ZZZZ
MSVENLKKEIQELESDIAGLEEMISAQASEKATALARMHARIFLEKIFEPYMDGLCDTWGVSPEEGLRILIKEKATLGKIAKDNPAALKELMNQPEIKVVVDIANPLKDVTNDWVNEKMDILFDVMMEIRPELARCIVETPEGSKWFYDSLSGLRKLFFGRPQINKDTRPSLK